MRHQATHAKTRQQSTMMTSLSNIQVTTPLSRALQLTIAQIWQIPKSPPQTKGPEDKKDPTTTTSIKQGEPQAYLRTQQASNTLLRMRRFATLHPQAFFGHLLTALIKQRAHFYQQAHDIKMRFQATQAHYHQEASPRSPRSKSIITSRHQGAISSCTSPLPPQGAARWYFKGFQDHFIKTPKNPS